jgi:hypothetical protein
VDELVLGPVQPFWAVCTAGCIAVFAFAWYAFLIKPDADDIPIGIAVALLAFVGFICVLSARNLFSEGLRLTDEGYEVNGRNTAWRRRSVRTCLELRRGREPRQGALRARPRTGTRAKVTGALGKVGLYLPPTYLHGWYKTGGRDLCGILQQWRDRYTGI